MALAASPTQQTSQTFYLVWVFFPRLSGALISGARRADETGCSIFLNMNYCWIGVTRCTNNPCFFTLFNHISSNRSLHSILINLSARQRCFPTSLFISGNALVNARAHGDNVAESARIHGGLAGTSSARSQRHLLHLIRQMQDEKEGNELLTRRSACRGSLTARGQPESTSTASPRLSLSHPAIP